MKYATVEIPLIAKVAYAVVVCPYRRGHVSAEVMVSPEILMSQTGEADRELGRAVRKTILRAVEDANKKRGSRTVAKRSTRSGEVA